MYGGVFDPDAIDKKIAEKTELTNAPGFWDDNKNAETVMNEIKMLKNCVEPWRELIKQIDDMEALYDLGMEASDQSVEAELREAYNKAKAEFDRQSILNLLSGEVDHNDAFLSIHAGAGGTEACDWTFMLSRMYIYIIRITFSIWIPNKNGPVQYLAGLTFACAAEHVRAPMRLPWRYIFRFNL